MKRMNHELEQAGFVNWNALSDEQRQEFFDGDDYLPLPANHAARIWALRSKPARELARDIIFGVPNYSWGAISDFSKSASIALWDIWEEPQGIARVRRWLHDRKLPYARRVYLVMDASYGLVVATDWKIVVNYWDAFWLPCGFETVIVDHSKQWACSFFHEDHIIFYSHG